VLVYLQLMCMQTHHLQLILCSQFCRSNTNPLVRTYKCARDNLPSSMMLQYWTQQGLAPCPASMQCSGQPAVGLQAMCKVATWSSSAHLNAACVLILATQFQGALFFRVHFFSGCTLF
jgi:hypothetical protein